MRRFPAVAILLISGLTLVWAQEKLSSHWEELTAADFRRAIEKSQGT